MPTLLVCQPPPAPPPTEPINPESDWWEVAARIDLRGLVWSVLDGQRLRFEPIDYARDLARVVARHRAQFVARVDNQQDWLVYRAAVVDIETLLAEREADVARALPGAMTVAALRHEIRLYRQHTNGTHFAIGRTLDKQLNQIKKSLV
jgi:hypothetical protein